MDTDCVAVQKSRVISQEEVHRQLRTTSIRTCVACIFLVTFALAVCTAIRAGNAKEGGLHDATLSAFGVGVGIHDVTGPAADVNMMGYAVTSQTTAGIHIRMHARAFVFVDNTSSKRFAFVSVDCGMAGQLMKTLVVEALEQRFPGVYSNDNVCISGTHTHSGTAGFLQYTLFQVTSLGYVKESADAFVNGIVEAITKAHNNVAQGGIKMAQGLLADANINRSPTSYMANPEDERNRYLSVGNSTDHLMVLLKVVNSTGASVGMLNWFAVHGTSMNNTNRLLSGDNKGYASQLFEQAINPASMPGQGPFVGAFAQTNLGDVSPNTNGPHCLDTGLPCDIAHSTCNGRNELCVASGPGRDMFESTQIIAEKQFTKAMELFSTANVSITGPIDFRHQFVHMPSVVVNNKTLCTPAMGYAFAAGTTDGPGQFNFIQGSTTSNPFWNLVSHVLATPSAETVACHAPKPILLDTGDVTVPYEWDPSIVPVQLLRIGNLVIIAVPGEFTTMSGRRLREAVKNTLVQNGMFSQDEGTVVIAGLSNTYASYIATYEEYQKQRYEAASTLYGPHTLEGYIQVFTKLAEAMAKGESVDPGPAPPNLLSKQISLLPGVIADGVPSGVNFGDVLTNPSPSYNRGDRVQVVFHSACPRNNLRTGDTFLAVQRATNVRRGKTTDTVWVNVALDAHWETMFHWYRHSEFSDQSFAQITWDIPQSAIPGTYRIQHYGDYKHFLGTVHSFTGTTSTFTVS